jgi:hypothetical protein
LDKIAEMLELEKIHLNKSVSEIENNLWLHTINTKRS